MADKDQVLKEKIGHSGIFDFGAFYKYAHDWFDDEGYGVVEEKYTEKVGGSGRNIFIEWTATKTITDYFKLELKLKFYIDNLTDVEVEIDGEKKKMNKGVINIEIKGTLIKDATNKWEASAWWQLLRNTYNKYIIPARVESLEFKVIADVQTFKDEVKAFLELSGKR